MSSSNRKLPAAGVEVAAGVPKRPPDGAEVVVEPNKAPVAGVDVAVPNKPPAKQPHFTIYFFQ